MLYEGTLWRSITRGCAIPLLIADHGRFLTSLRELNRPYGFTALFFVGTGVLDSPDRPGGRSLRVRANFIVCVITFNKSRITAAPRHRPTGWRAAVLLAKTHQWPSPRRGRGTATAVDEDAGIYFAEKCFGIRLFEGVHHSLHIADLGPVLTSLRELNRPYGFVRCFL